MEIRKIKVNKILAIFLLVHLIIWTLVPSISNDNLPLDTIEALAWGSNLDWGYNKHPPLSAWSVEVFYQLFKNYKKLKLLQCGIICIIPHQDNSVARISLPRLPYVTRKGLCNLISITD